MQFSHVQLHSGDGMSKKSLNGETPGAGGPRARGRRHVRPQLAHVRLVSLVGKVPKRVGLISAYCLISENMVDSL